MGQMTIMHAPALIRALQAVRVAPTKERCTGPERQTVRTDTRRVQHKHSASTKAGAALLLQDPPGRRRLLELHGLKMCA